VAGSRLILVLAAVFAGLTAVLVVAALAVQPFLLLVAVPFAATTYFLWFHATGRLADRASRRQPGVGRDARTASDHRAESADGGRRFRDRFRERVDAEGAATAGRATGTRSGRGPRGENRTAGAGRYRADGRRTRSQTAYPNAESDISRADARRVLGVSPEADQEAIRSAYRERVKRAHPDTAAGDEESFKRINRAYERLRED
jgi:hypothetical protein